MTHHRGEYPPDWNEIAQAVKDEAGWKCEHCHHPHEPETGHTLTVHHLNGDKANCSRQNLVALCQKCHLSLQVKYLPGQKFLPGLTPDWVISRDTP